MNHTIPSSIYSEKKCTGASRLSRSLIPWRHTLTYGHDETRTHEWRFVCAPLHATLDDGSWPWREENETFCVICRRPHSTASALP